MIKAERKICKNCGNPFNPLDDYCRYCGEKNEFTITNRDIPCIYGPPPVIRVHKCENCSYSWETDEMVDDEKYCPKCGGNAPVVEEKDEAIFDFYNWI